MTSPTMNGWSRWNLSIGRGYEEAKSGIDEMHLDFVSRYALWREYVEVSEGNWTEGDAQSPDSYNGYKDPVFQYLHSKLMPHLEEITGLTLLPTYCYFRVYRPGATLAPHKDRPACEVSATLLVGTNQDETWPLFIDGEKIIQQVGDFAVYRGCEVEHSREPMTGPEDAWQIQAFIHHVDADGPYTMCAGDQVRL